MIRKLISAAAIACCVLAVGCSSTPSPAKPSAAAPVAAAPAPAAASSATPDAKIVMVPMTSDLTALTKAARSEGYTPRTRNGTVVFCKTDQQIGTRFQSMSCISQDDVALVVQRAQDQRNDVQALQRKSLNGPTGN
jgi:hypothetical protein